MMEIFGKIFSASRTGEFDEGSIKATGEKKFQELLSESIKMAKSGVEIVAWSEGATFIFKNNEEMYIEQAIQSDMEHEFYFVIGLMVLHDNCQELLINKQPFLENKLLFISPTGNFDWEYSKLNLAPGYEKIMTIPGDGILKSSNTARGTVTGAICYDMDFSQYIRQTGLMKSDLLISSSSDWLEIKNTHTKMARLRAIENGISLLRPANSGISIAVDPYGNILSSIDDFTSNGAPLISSLPMGSVQTLYTTLGDFWTWICAFGGIILIIIGIVRTAKHKSWQ
ncbi:nitrilase-related carbon-nitrogen hydrolase [Bacteroidota bacterium]